jgi:hypothetical protein
MGWKGYAEHLANAALAGPILGRAKLQHIGLEAIRIASSIQLFQ